MDRATQISGNMRSANKALIALKSMLTHTGIHVTHPTKSESFFYIAGANPSRQNYEKKLEFYDSIAHSTFHIVYNDGCIDNEIGLQALYAMLKERPIVMTGAPVFSDNISLFIRDTLKKNLDKFHSVNLAELELVELSLLLKKLQPTSYSLTKHEKVLINSRVKALFRELLNKQR